MEEPNEHQLESTSKEQGLLGRADSRGPAADPAVVRRRRGAAGLRGLAAQLVAIVGTVFTLLAILGIVADPTTAGVGDSEQAMTYDEPKEG